MNWPLLLDLARYHRVGLLVYRTISTVCADLVPQDSLDALRQGTLAGTFLCRAFDESGMPAVSFQGSTFVAMAYKDLSLRDFDDFGFIVPQHRLAAAQRVLWSQGYRPRDQSHDERDAGHTDEPYCVFVKNNSVLRVDLQWVIVHEQFAFRLDRSEVWRHRVLVSTDGQGHGS